MIQHLQILLDDLFCRLQEIMQVITEICFHIIMYQTFDLPVKNEEEAYEKIKDIIMTMQL